MLDSEINTEGILEEFGIQFDSRPVISQFGGMAPFVQLLKKGKIRERLAEQIGGKKARSVMQVLLSIICGGSDMEDCERVGTDRLMKKYLRKRVDATQLTRDFKSFSKEQIEKLHEFNMSLAILEIVQDIPQKETLVLDIDATSVEKHGSQEGVELGYIERDKIDYCYQYLFFHLFNLRTFLYGTIRSGSTHSQNGFCSYLERFLPMFRKQWKLAIRCDAGYFNEEAFDVCSENDTTFYVKAPMIEQRYKQVNYADLNWLGEDKNSKVVYASTLTKTEKGTNFREIFRRTLIEDKNQFSLIPNYRYDCLATNDFIKTEWDAFEFYNGRANIENNIRELKNDYHLGKIATSSFDANDVITQITLLAYILMQHFKRKALPKEMARMQLGTLRWRIFNIPGKIIFSGRRELTRLYNIFANSRLYEIIFYKVKHLNSWVLAPPILSA